MQSLESAARDAEVVCAFWIYFRASGVEPLCCEYAYLVGFFFQLPLIHQTFLVQRPTSQQEAETAHSYYCGHVEHDAVAVSVCKHNHKGDGINHTYVETFQEIYGSSDDPDEAKVASLVEKHGPFDLVLAGAPCQNYSSLNSHRGIGRRRTPSSCQRWGV